MKKEAKRRKVHKRKPPRTPWRYELSDGSYFGASVLLGFLPLAVMAVAAAVHIYLLATGMTSGGMFKGMSQKAADLLTITPFYIMGVWCLLTLHEPDGKLAIASALPRALPFVGHSCSNRR